MLLAINHISFHDSERRWLEALKVETYTKSGTTNENKKVWVSQLGSSALTSTISRNNPKKREEFVSMLPLERKV